MSNDNDSRFNKNHGTSEPSLNDNVTKSDCQNNSTDYDDLIPSSYLDGAPDLDYSDCYIPDDEYGYDDLAVICGINETAYSQVEQRIPQEANFYLESIENMRQSPIFKQEIARGKNYLKRASSGKKSYFVTNQRFVLESLLACVELGIRSVKVKADMKAGKTFAVEWLIKHHPKIKTALVITAVSALIESIVFRANDKHCIDSCSYADLELDSDDALKHELIGSTFNSLHKVAEKRCSYAFDLVLIDESENCANFMHDGTINNKYQAGETLRKISKASNFVVLADAHLHSDTHAFASMFLPDRDFCQLFNNFQPWFGCTRSNLEDYDAGIAYVEKMLFLNKKLLLTFTSASLLIETMRALKNEGITMQLKTIAVAGKTKQDKNVSDAISDNEKFKLYELAAISPVAGTGTSIEGEHFHQTIAFTTRDTSTPNARSALQNPFRGRDLIDKHIVVVKINNKLKAGDIKSFEQIDKDADLNQRLYTYLSKKAMKDSEAAGLCAELRQSHSFYDARMKKNSVASYWKFWDIFDSEMDKKGIKLIESASEVPTFDATEAKKKAREQIKDEIKQQFCSESWIDDERTEALKTKSKHDSNSMTEKETVQLKKKLIIERFTPLNQINHTPTNEQAINAMDMQDKGYSKMIDDVHVSQLNYKDVDKLQYSYFNGIGEYHSHKLDIADDTPLHLHTEHKVYRALSKIVGMSVGDDGMYSIKETVINKKLCTSNKGHRNQIKAIAVILANFNAINNKQLSIKQLKSDPLSFVAEHLKKGFGLKLRKARGKDEYVVVGTPVLDIVNAKINDNHNKYIRKLHRIHNSIVSHKQSERYAEAIKAIPIDELVSKFSVHVADSEYVMNQLAQIPAKIAQEAMTKYAKKATGKNSKIGNLSPRAKANLYINSVAESHAKTV